MTVIGVLEALAIGAFVGGGLGVLVRHIVLALQLIRRIDEERRDDVGRKLVRTLDDLPVLDGHHLRGDTLTKLSRPTVELASGGAESAAASGERAAR